MEEPKAVVAVLDISSDEEADGVDIIRGIRKLLDDDDKVEGLKDDPDDLVVMVGEVCVNLEENMKKKFSSDDDECVVLGGDPDGECVVLGGDPDGECVVLGGDPDGECVVLDGDPDGECVVLDGDPKDDCVVLDSDPDKPRMVENVCGNDDDDLVVVSEKGEVACRDFPHPRHHCAKYPFSSSQHELHCDQCHCYVCDSLAPCVHWGTGVSSVSHCHATEKEAFWKSQRTALQSVEVPMNITVPPVQ